MKQAYAFFDVDGTLLRGKSMFDFHDYWYLKWTAPDSLAIRHEHEDIRAILDGLIEHGAPRELVNRRYYEFFAGRQVSAVTRCAEAWAEEALRNPAFFIEPVCERLHALHAKGIEPVFVSGSFVELLRPIAARLGVGHILATRLVKDGAKYNGRLQQPQTIGVGKMLAMERFLAEHEASAGDCWAFGDDISDVPMLEAVGQAVAVIGDPTLAAAAKRRGWECVDLDADERVTESQALVAAA